MAKSRAGKKQRQSPRSTSRPTTTPPVRPEPAPVPDVSVVFEPVAGAPYPELLRNPGYVWWRALLGVLLALVLYSFLIFLIAQVVVALGWLILGKPQDYPTFYTGALRFERPVGMLGVNLGIAALVLVTFLVMVLVHRTQPRWVASVDGRLRWRYLLLCVPVAFVVFGITLAIGAVVSPGAGLNPEPRYVGFLVVILFTSPLQAAAEEVFFRGYLMQALGSLVANPWFGVVVSATVFALLHGATQSPPLFFDRFAFGLIAATLVLKTGGLEAGIAIHVVNNWLAFGIATLTSSVAAAYGLTTITWTQAGLDVGGFGLFAVIAYLLARKLKLRTRATGLGPDRPL
ncbi:MAG: CPBP family intramembrane glutamic endopeptidase [Propionibacteriaceae bacterium]